MENYNLNQSVVATGLLYRPDGRLEVTVQPGTPIREQLLNLLSQTKQYIDSIPYKEEAQYALLGLQTALGGPVKTAISIVGNTITESLFGEKVDQIKTEAATEIAARLRYQHSSEDVLPFDPEGFDEDVDAAKFGLNLAVGAVGTVVAGKIIHRNPLTAKKGDVIVTPQIDPTAFVRTIDGAWKHKKTGAIYEKSNTTHTG